MRRRRNANFLMCKFRAVVPVTLTDASPNQSIVINCSLDDFTAGGEVASACALFEQYKICGESIKFMPHTTQNDMSSMLFETDVASPTVYGSVYVLPTVYHATDFVDNIPWAAPADALQYAALKTVRGNRVWTRFWKPAFLTVMQDDAASPANIAAGPRRGWLSTSTSGQTVRHRGLKILVQAQKNVDQGSNKDLPYADMIHTVYVCFRKRR